MHYNTSKCKELVLRNSSNLSDYPMLYNIKQYSSIPILGITIQGNCKFCKYVKTKLFEANKCLFITRSLRKKGYTQEKVDILFNAIVLSKILYGLPVYATSASGLTVVLCFFRRCYKTRHISVMFDVSELLEKCDCHLFNKMNNRDHPQHSFLPRHKESSTRLRNRSNIRPKIDTERFKDSFLNRLIFKYNLAV